MKKLITTLLISFAFACGGEAEAPQSGTTKQQIIPFDELVKKCAVLRYEECVPECLDYASGWVADGGPGECLTKTECVYEQILEDCKIYLGQYYFPRRRRVSLPSNLNRFQNAIPPAAGN